jgi:hypothetical protein
MYRVSIGSFRQVLLGYCSIFHASGHEFSFGVSDQLRALLRSLPRYVKLCGCPIEPNDALGTGSRAAPGSDHRATKDRVSDGKKCSNTKPSSSYPSNVYGMIRAICRGLDVLLAFGQHLIGNFLFHAAILAYLKAPRQTRMSRLLLDMSGKNKHTTRIRIGCGRQQMTSRSHGSRGEQNKRRRDMPAKIGAVVRDCRLPLRTMQLDGLADDLQLVLPELHLILARLATTRR